MLSLLKEGDVSIIPMMNNRILHFLVQDLQRKPGVESQVDLYKTFFPLPRPHNRIQIRIVYPNTGEEFKTSQG